MKSRQQKMMTRLCASVVVSIVLAGAVTLIPGGSAAASWTFASPGTYTATAPGKVGDVTVEVTVSDSSIDSVTVTSHEETPGIGDMAVNQIPGAILAAQSTSVDAVATATVTSEAILAAVDDCLTQAGGSQDA